MKKVIGYLLLVISGCLVASCYSSHFVIDESDLSKAQAKYPGITQNDLIAGRKLYIANCSTCHNLHQPTEFTEAKWLELVPDMAKEAKLSDAEAKLIEQFVITKATL